MATLTIMTGAQFDALPEEEGSRYELLEGFLLETPTSRPRNQRIASKIWRALEDHLTVSSQKAITIGHVEFALDSQTRLQPDVCVLLAEKAEGFDWDRIPIPGAPDIAVEVISPSEKASESYAKVWAYLNNGATEVWQIYPASAMAEIYRGTGSIAIGSDGEITSPLLPNFALSLKGLFQT